jgi:hypothetical protein
MNLRKHNGLVHPLLLAVGLSCGLSLGFAQTKSAPQTKPTAPSQTQVSIPAPKTSGWVKDPNSVMPMRKMTNAERRAAAERNKARRAKAAAQKQQSTTNTQGGVQR